MNTPTLTAEQKIIAVIAELASKEESSCKPDAGLVDDLGMDSLDLVELAMSIEEAFDIGIPDDAAEKWKTVADVTGYVAGLGK